MGKGEKANHQDETMTSSFATPQSIPTPRTDAISRDHYFEVSAEAAGMVVSAKSPEDCYREMRDHACQLERELDGLRAMYRAAVKMVEEESAVSAVQGGESMDRHRLDWLEQHHVEVRKPLVYGSRAMFHASPEQGDGDETPSDLRAEIDKAMGFPVSPLAVTELPGGGIVSTGDSRGQQTGVAELWGPPKQDRPGGPVYQTGSSNGTVSSLTNAAPQAPQQEASSGVVESRTDGRPKARNESGSDTGLAAAAPIDGDSNPPSVEAHGLKASISVWERISQGFPEVVLDLTLTAAPHINAGFRWSGKTALELVESVSTIDAKEADRLLSATAGEKR